MMMSRTVSVIEQRPISQTPINVVISKIYRKPDILVDFGCTEETIFERGLNSTAAAVSPGRRGGAASSAAATTAAAVSSMKLNSGINKGGNKEMSGKWGFQSGKRPQQ